MEDILWPEKRGNAPVISKWIPRWYFR